MIKGMKRHYPQSGIRRRAGADFPQNNATGRQHGFKAGSVFFGQLFRFRRRQIPLCIFYCFVFFVRMRRFNSFVRSFRRIPDCLWHIRARPQTRALFSIRKQPLPANSGDIRNQPGKKPPALSPLPRQNTGDDRQKALSGNSLTKPDTPCPHDAASAIFLPADSFCTGWRECIRRW